MSRDIIMYKSAFNKTLQMKKDSLYMKSINANYMAFHNIPFRSKERAVFVLKMMTNFGNWYYQFLDGTLINRTYDEARVALNMALTLFQKKTAARNLRTVLPSVAEFVLSVSSCSQNGTDGFTPYDGFEKNVYNGLTGLFYPMYHTGEIIVLWKHC